MEYIPKDFEIQRTYLKKGKMHQMFVAMQAHTHARTHAHALNYAPCVVIGRGSSGYVKLF